MKEIIHKPLKKNDGDKPHALVNPLFSLHRSYFCTISGVICLLTDFAALMKAERETFERKMNQL